MSKFMTSVSSVSLPMYIPRRDKSQAESTAIVGDVMPRGMMQRGKAYVQVLAKVKVQAVGFIDPVEFVHFCQQYGGQTFLRDTAATLASEIGTELKLGKVTIEVLFSLAIDRISVGFDSVYYELPCAYVAEYENGKTTTRMQVRIPVQVLDVQPAVASLVFTVEHPNKNVFFEDMLDHVQRCTGAILYPLTSVQDRPKLQESLEKSSILTPYALLGALQDGSERRGLGKSVSALVENADVYSMMTFSYFSQW